MGWSSRLTINMNHPILRVTPGVAPWFFSEGVKNFQSLSEVNQQDLCLDVSEQGAKKSGAKIHHLRAREFGCP